MKKFPPRVKRLRVALLVSGLVVSATVGVSASATLSPSRSLASGPLACTNASVLSSWSLPALIHETIVVPVEAMNISQAAPIARAGYGGIILFGTTGPKNFSTVVAGLQRDAPDGAGLFIMTDDEGGGVWRLSNLLTPLPWARTLSEQTPAKIESLAAGEARAMRALGITMDLAPVLDIDGKNVEPGASDADGYRSFSGNGSIVESDGDAFMKGLVKGGVVPVIKHFPGLGGVSPNTDDGPASTAPWPLVQKVAIKPFVSAIKDGAPAMMISNAKIPGLTSLPATVSAAVYQYIRTDMNFTGLLLTDSLSAGAVSGADLSVPAASVDAIIAGADMVLFGIPAKGSALALATTITDRVFAAVSQHRLSRAALEAAADLVVTTRGVNLCAS